MSQEHHHTIHLHTKFKLSNLFFGLVIGGAFVSGMAVEYRFLEKRIEKQEARVVSLETEVFQYRKRAWLFVTVEDKLKDEKAQVRHDVAEAIWTMSKSKKLPVELILGVIEVESNWTLDADNGYAMGAMQVVPGTAASYLTGQKSAVKSGLVDPVTNIIAGCSHLAELHNKYVKDKVEAIDEFAPTLCAYNSGRLLGKNNKQLTNYGYAMKVKEVAFKYSELFKTEI